MTPDGFEGLASQILRKANEMDSQRQGGTLRATSGTVRRAQMMKGDTYCGQPLAKKAAQRPALKF
jgi:hypothetical protein